MQARVDWILIIFGIQVIKKKRPGRPVFPDYLSVSYDYGLRYLYMFSLIEGSFENTCMCRFLYVYICTEGCFYVAKGWWLCLGMCLYIFIYIIYIIYKSVIYALYMYIYIYIYIFVYTFIFMWSSHSNYQCVCFHNSENFL